MLLNWRRNTCVCWTQTKKGEIYLDIFLYLPRKHQHPSHLIWIFVISLFGTKKFICVSLHVPSSSENDLTFHFFGAENDSIKVRESINRMVEKGRIGNFSLISTHYALHQEPGLVLQVSWFIIIFLWVTKCYFHSI